MDTSSPRITEYGSVRETKNGLKTLRVVGFEIPSPEELDMAKALATQLVIVSGTLTDRTIIPVFSLLPKQNKPLAYHKLLFL